MPELVPFNPAHLESLSLRVEQKSMRQLFSPEYGRALAEHGVHTYSVVDQGEILLCMGLMPLWGRVAEAWMLVGPDVWRASTYLYRLLSWGLPTLPFKRIQATVRCDFAVGQRFAERLGFVNEGIMRAYDLEGLDVYRYARVQ